MARVGLIGGLGHESTIDYYRRINDVWRESQPTTFPAVLIDSLDVDRGIQLVQHDRPGFVEYLRDSRDRLVRAGVDFIAIAANTPHVVFDELSADSPVPMLSIVEVCAQEASARGLHRVALLGTRFTMESDMFPRALARLSIAVHTPGREHREWLHERYIGELLRGTFRDDTRAGVLTLVEELTSRTAIDAIVLAGTELPLLLRQDRLLGLPVLDTTELHVRAIVNRLLSHHRDTGAPPSPPLVAPGIATQ